jgi:hypothetical protein
LSSCLIVLSDRIDSREVLQSAQVTFGRQVELGGESPLRNGSGGREILSGRSLIRRDVENAGRRGRD